MKTLLSVSWRPVLKRHTFGSAVDGANEIAAWMWDDMPDGESSIEFWIDKFNAVADGKIDGDYLGTGNAHHVRAVGEEVFLECQFVDEMKVLLTRAQIIAALEGYRAFLEEDSGDPDRRPSPFEVEYEAVGEEALERYLKTGGKLGCAR